MLETTVICTTLFFLVLIYSLYSILKLYDKKSKEYVVDLDNIKLDHDKNLLSTQIEIQEQTFENISREIHDNIGQKLSLIKLNLNTLSKHQSGSDLEKINCSKNLISTVISDLRDLSQTLGSDNILANGLVKAIEFDINQLRKSGNYEIFFKVLGEQIFLDTKKELILFRIFQEVLNNIMKHADATTIFIDITFDKHTFTIQIKDDGIGYPEVENNSGTGIKNMRKRVRLIGGDFEIKSNSGTLIKVEIPL
jgi:two-component system, NarL family, sensor kinase